MTNNNDIEAALNWLNNCSDAMFSDLSIKRTIRNALTQQQPVNAELLEALKLCLPRIEEIRLVDLGAVRDAEMQDYYERKVLARRELAETNELINKINSVIAKAEKKV